MTTLQRRRLLGAALVIGTLALSACQPAADAPTPSGPPPSAASASSAPATASASLEPSIASSPSASNAAEDGAGEEVSVFDVEIGDCFDVDGEEEVESVTVVDCEQPHTYEAFRVFDHEAADYPGDDAISDYADTECQSEFEAFVGHDYDTSIWYISWITPSAETWAAGDREILCTVHQQDENGEPIEVTGSAEGSGE